MSTSDRTSQDSWRFLWSYVRKDLRYLVLALVCALGSSGLSLLVGFLLKPFVSATTGAQSAAKNAPPVTAHELHQLSIISLGLVGIYAVRWIFVYGESVLFSEIGQRLGLRLRSDLYRHLQRLSLSFFNHQRTGALMSTMNSDVPLIQGTVSSLKDIADGPFKVIGGLVWIFSISVPLSLAAILALPAMAYTISRFTRLIRQVTRRTQDKMAQVNTIMQETLSGVRVIQSFSAEQIEIDRFEREIMIAKNLTMSNVRQSSKLKPTNDLIGALGIAAALWIAGSLVARGALTLGELLTFIYVLQQIADGISSLGGVRVTSEQLRAAAGRIQDNVLDVEPEIRNAPDAVALPATQGSVEFENVAFAYNPEAPVLRDISFTIDPGDIVAIVGPSGAGKSTIADLIPRFYDPTAGQVRINGLDIRQVTLESLRQQIGIVPQDIMLFSGTIRDNIAYGRPGATEEEIQNAAIAANAHNFISDPNTLPDGYNTIVGERGKQLSGGQRQRVAIARALLKDPRILILDEATSALDTESEDLIRKALNRLMVGRTTLIISHRLSTIPSTAKIMVLQDGRLAEAGTHAVLIDTPGSIYAQQYEKQFHRDEKPEPLSSVAPAPSP